MKSISKSFVLGGTCAEEVIACINNLRNTSSSRIDGISTKFLQLAKSTIAPVLAKLFNMSMECGEYPDCLKISQTVPIPKKHGKLLMNCIVHIKNSLLILIV